MQFHLATRTPEKVLCKRQTCLLTQDCLPVTRPIMRCLWLSCAYLYPEVPDISSQSWRLNWRDTQGKQSTLLLGKDGG